MVGYSEVLQTIGAMVIFSLILLSSTRMIQRNTYMQISGELEQEIVALGQEIIEEGRTKEYDEVTHGAAPPANIPGDFTAPSELGPEADDDVDGDGTVRRPEFDDFDDYDGWSDLIATEHGEFNIRAEVFYVDATSYDSTGTETTFKKMRVYITSKYLNQNNPGELNQYRLEFIRNYYAD